MYNCALEHRIAVYQARGSGTTYENQAGELPAIKKMEAMRAAGIAVAESPAELGSTMAEALAAKA